MRALSTNPNIDNSDIVNYPGGRIKNNSGTGNGTPVDERVYGDLHQNIAKMLRLYNITPNNLPDNETNSFQIIQSIVALASKNDFVLPITESSGILVVPIKFGFMLTGEQVVCKASVELDIQTQIKGSDNVLFTINPSGLFQIGEYVRIIKTNAGVDMIRLVDNISLNSMVGDLNYLKKASQAEENAGAIDSKATTPLVNLVAFTKRVIGLDSPGFLATAIRNGLYPKEHFVLVTGLSAVKNVGWFSGLDIPASGSLAVSGDIASAVVTNIGGGVASILVTLANNMTNTNYYVRMFIESQGSISSDLNSSNFLFKPINVNSFTVGVAEYQNGSQSLKVHIEVVQR